jgi:alkenylglycerophosphocholine/alkenylglycerophosphoethanolamine hydrolase
MSYRFLWLAFTIAPLDWLSVSKDWRKIEYLAKPAVILSLLAWLGINNGVSGEMIWFGYGLFFSLIGDICLLFPNKLFVAGLVCFLLTQITYTLAFNPTFPPVNIASMILAALVGITTAQVYKRISAGLAKSGHDNLKIPFLIYSIAISLMLLSATLTLIRPSWEACSAILVSSGAILFFISDLILSWNRYVNPIPNGRLLTIVTYHLGQFGIIIGAALHYLG